MSQFNRPTQPSVSQDPQTQQHHLQHHLQHHQQQQSQNSNQNHQPHMASVPSGAALPASYPLSQHAQLQPAPQQQPVQQPVQQTTQQLAQPPTTSLQSDLSRQPPLQPQQRKPFNSIYKPASPIVSRAGVVRSGSAVSISTNNAPAPDAAHSAAAVTSGPGPIAIGAGAGTTNNTSSLNINSSASANAIGATPGLLSHGTDEAPVSLSLLENLFSEKLFPNNVLPKINVLVVEDNVINQIILSSFLRKNNIPFKLISNGRDALKEWRKGGYQLILMDIQLPFISGIYCAKEIRRLESVNGIGVSNQRGIHNLINSSQQLPTSPSSNSMETANKLSSDSITRLTASKSPRPPFFSGTDVSRGAVSQSQLPQQSPGKFLQRQHSQQKSDQDSVTTVKTGSSKDRLAELQQSTSSFDLLGSGSIKSEASAPLITSPISESAIANELRREDSPNPLTDETASDKLDVSKFKQPVIIVALTANSFTEDRDNALAAGCNDFLVKPVNLLWLGKKFTEWGCMQALINFDGWERASRKNVNSAVVENEKTKRQGKNIDLRIRRLLRQVQLT